MPLVFLPEARVFFLWAHGGQGVDAALVSQGQAGLAEVVQPSGSRALEAGAVIPLHEALSVLVPREGDAQAGASASVAAWAQAARFAAELVASERLVPRVTETVGGFDARWSVSLAEPADRAYFQQLARAFPPAAHAVPVSVEGGEAWAPAELLRVFLDEAADALVRRSAARLKLPAALRPPAPGPGEEAALQERSWGKRWGIKLAAPDRRMSAAGLIERRMADAVESWGQGLLGATDRLRAAFRLELPSRDEGPFLLRFLLQDPDDLSLLIAADEIWSSDGRHLQRMGKVFRDPAASLLRSLAQAAAIFPPIARALGHVAPEAIELDAQGAWGFLGDTARKLTDAGFSVLVPGELTDAGRRVRSQMDFDSFDRMADQLLGPDEPALDEWVAFEWRVALGDTTLSREEFEALVRQKAPLVKHRGQWVVIDPSELPEIQARLKSKGGKVRTRDALVGALAGEMKFNEARVRAQAVGRFAALLGRLREGATRDAAAPASLRATLRPYQGRGLAWLSMMASLGLGGILADDMGLGKTVQLLALLLRRREEPYKPGAPSLLVAPTSVVGNWEREIARFAPSLPVVRHHGAGRPSSLRAMQARLKEQPGALVLTTYGLLWRDVAILRKVSWGLVAMDEAQNIKNAQTSTASAARALPARQRFALTGTPVENRLSELWSILDFVNPGLLGSEESFARDYAVPIERGGDDQAAARLRRVVGPFVLRRHKSDPTIAPDLPAKDENNVICTLTREQATLYQATVDEIMAAIAAASGMARRGLILTLLTKLKQICNHPAQFLREAGPLPRRSGKLTRLQEMLEECLAEGEKALVFTQFREMGDRLCRHLERTLKVEVLYLHGQTPREERDRMVERFQQSDAGSPPLFVLSLKAGGTGLNLTAASQVYHYDRWWNPAVEDQATDRAYRIGQDKHVQVFKFVCAGTVEDRIDRMIEKKKSLAGKIISEGESWITELGDTELRDLFALSPEASIDEENPGKTPRRKARG